MKRPNFKKKSPVNNVAPQNTNTTTAPAEEEEGIVFEGHGLSYTSMEGEEILLVTIGQDVHEVDLTKIGNFKQAKNGLKTLKNGQGCSPANAAALKASVRKMLEIEENNKAKGTPAKTNVGEVLEGAGIKAQDAQPKKIITSKSQQQKSATSAPAKGASFNYLPGTNYIGSYIAAENSVLMDADGTTFPLAETKENIPGKAKIEVTILKAGNISIALFGQVMSAPIDLKSTVSAYLSAYGGDQYNEDGILTEDPIAIHSEADIAALLEACKTEDEAFNALTELLGEEPESVFSFQDASGVRYLGVLAGE